MHVEAEWARANPVDETVWLTALAQRMGRPSALVAHAQLDRADVAEILAAQAAFPMVRGIRQKPDQRHARRRRPRAGGIDGR
ncbi:hypothetical protein ACU4GD_32225 [Cupriavidus basilensis]